MKLIVILTFTLGLTWSYASVYSQGGKLTVHAKNTTIKDVLKQIEEQSEYSFMYNASKINIYREVDVNIKNSTVNNVLNEIFSGEEVYFKFLDRNILLFSEPNRFANIQIVNQENVIKGKVTDTKGNPLPGVNVVEKGTINGAITNLDGEYSISIASPGAILTFSYIGFLTEDVEINDQSTINITLVEDIMSLDEVVVIAYGTQSKKKVTGAIQTVNSNELSDLPVAVVTQKLQNKLAGVQINQTTGIPGQGLSVRIRGQASISAGNEPLYVVDGFPITGDINDINADEIESVTVLKDASSTALYGSRAANGVVMVTTKQAKKGMSSLTFNFYAGVQQIPQKGRPDMMNAREFAQFKKEVAEENGQPVDEMFQNPDQYGEGTNWYDAITRTAQIQSYSLSYSSSKDNFSTSVVGGYFKQDGVLLNSNFERYSLRANSTYKFNDKIKIGMNVAPTVTSNNTPNSDGYWWSSPTIIQTAILASPLAPYKNEDGTIPINTSGYGTITAPNMYNQVRIVKNTTKNVGLLSNGFIEIMPFEGLSLKSNINVELGNSISDFFFPSTAGGMFNAGNEADASRIYATHSNVFNYSWLWENIASFKKEINNHYFELLGGHSAQVAHLESGFQRGSDFPDNRIHTLNAAKTITGNTDIQEWALESFFTRLNYNYKQKYILSVAFRKDGSSKFGVDKRWGSFPSASVGWVVSEEKFMENVKEISFMKIRASYGVTGNNNIGNYTQYANITNTNNPVNGVYMSGKSLAGLNNTNLGWERTTEYDFGADISIINNRISLSYDYFNRITDNLLYAAEIPISSGFFNFTTNIGKLAFWGHEITLTSKNTQGEFKWTTDFNISFNRNKALALGTSNATIYGDDWQNTITEVGKPIGLIYGMKWEGLYMTQEDYDNSPKYAGAEVGMAKFKDVNGDGVVTFDDNDKTVLGNAAPKGIYGITNTFLYKNWDLSIVAGGAYGNEIINRAETFSANLDGAFNVLRDVDKRWRSEENPGDGRFGKVKAGTTYYERDYMNSRMMYSANYLTIKNITLGYQLPANKIKYIKGLRIYTSIQQAFVFTKYPGNNPEVSAAGGLFSGNDMTTYPIPRTITFGANFSL